MKTEKDMLSLDEFKDEHYGKIGTKTRDEIEEGFERFKKELKLPKV